jgi:hypothetical protein
MSATPSRPGRRPDPALRDLWHKRLQLFEQSGLSAAAFCSNEGLPLHTFYSWRRRLRCQSPAPGAGTAHGPAFLPVRILPHAPSAPVELLLPHGPVLRLTPGCDLSFVRSLVDALGGAPC